MKLSSRILIIFLFLSIYPGSYLPAAGQDRTTTVYLPLLQSTSEWISIQSRGVSAAFYHTDYQAFELLSTGWTGTHNPCNPGSTSNDFKQAVLRRLNYFRKMAGVPPLQGFSDEYNRSAQEAALMMSVNGSLDHTPPDSWSCFTPAGSQGAGSSNLSLGVFGPAAVTGQMRDDGQSNYPVGHRRWILYPQTRWMGTGDVPSAATYRAAHVLWVFDNSMSDPRPRTRDGFVAWPPPGYVPYQIVFPRWSFSYPEADFSNARVQMSQGSQTVQVVLHPVVPGFGENTLVWEPRLSTGVPASDLPYTVRIQNVRLGGEIKNFEYTPIVFNPASE